MGIVVVPLVGAWVIDAILGSGVRLGYAVMEWVCSMMPQ